MIIELIYFLLPAAIANMMPVFMKNKMFYLKYPLDFNKKIKEKRILGDNKTFRGLIAAVIGSVITVYIQLILYDFKFFRNISLVDYSQTGFLIFGFLIGFSVIFGDAVSSFIKRRLNIKSGESLLVIDQINGILGLGLIVFPIYLKSIKIFFYLTLIWIIGHFILKYLGYLFKIDNKKI